MHSLQFFTTETAAEEESQEDEQQYVGMAKLGHTWAKMAVGNKIN